MLENQAQPAIIQIPDRSRLRDFVRLLLVQKMHLHRLLSVLDDLHRHDYRFQEIDFVPWTCHMHTRDY